MLSVWLLPPHGPGGGLLRHFESAWAPTKTVGFLSSFEIEKMGKRLRSRSGLSSRGLLFLVSRLGHASEAIVAFPCLHHTPWRRGEVQMAPLEPSFFFMGFVPPFVQDEGVGRRCSMGLPWPGPPAYSRAPPPHSTPLHTPYAPLDQMWALCGHGLSRFASLKFTAAGGLLPIGGGSWWVEGHGWPGQGMGSVLRGAPARARSKGVIQCGTPLRGAPLAWSGALSQRPGF